MPELRFSIPDEAVPAEHADPERFACELRLAAAMFWYSRSEISMGIAARIAGLSIEEFLDALAAHQVDSFVVDLEQLDRELALG
jgi:predicted HTH domain antitoxin